MELNVQYILLRNLIVELNKSFLWLRSSFLKKRQIIIRYENKLGVQVTLAHQRIKKMIQQGESNPCPLSQTQRL
jgi:hypothetical protein